MKKNIVKKLLLCVILLLLSCLSISKSKRHIQINIHEIIETASDTVKLYYDNTPVLNDSLFVSEIDISPIKKILMTANQFNKKVIWKGGCVLLLSNNNRLIISDYGTFFKLNNYKCYFVLTEGIEKYDVFRKQELYEKRLTPFGIKKYTPWENTNKN